MHVGAVRFLASMVEDPGTVHSMLTVAAVEPPGSVPSDLTFTP
jgi:hypothetical protein